MDSREIQPRGVGNGRGSDSGQIKAEIDETRGRIDETLEALSDKLHPRHLLDEVLDYLRNPGELKNTAGKLGQGIWHQVQQHPMPSLLIGAGLAWMFNEKKQRREVSYVETGELHGLDVSGMYEAELYETGEPMEYPTGESSEGSMRESAGNIARRAKESAGHFAHSAKETAGNVTQGVKESASHMAHSAKEKAGEIAGSIKEKAGHLSHSLKEGTMHQAGRIKDATSRLRSEGRARAGAAYRTAEDKFYDARTNYPLAIGLGFLAVGVLAGLSLPRTRIEDETMGDRADRLKETVREQGQRVVETAKSAASAAVSTAKEHAHSEGLTPGTLAEKVKHVASDAVHAAAESAKREGLAPENLSQQAQNIGSEAKRAAQEEIERSKNR
jgi:hypothetical protein